MATIQGLLVDRGIEPKSIKDIIGRTHEYLSVMRESKAGDVVSLMEFFTDYVKSSSREWPRKDQELHQLSVECTDLTYRKISQLDVRDVYSAGYFGLVISEIFWQFRQRGIYNFYILDNHLRDDRFKAAVELMGSAGFAPIYPYVTNELIHSTAYTRFPIKPYVEIVTKIYEAMNQKRNILYIEKDRTVDYLKNIFQLAEELQNQYTVGFRNKDPAVYQESIWLHGSFRNLLK